MCHVCDLSLQVYIVVVAPSPLTLHLLIYLIFLDFCQPFTIVIKFTSSAIYSNNIGTENEKKKRGKKLTYSALLNVCFRRAFYRFVCSDLNRSFCSSEKEKKKKERKKESAAVVWYKWKGMQLKWWSPVEILDLKVD